MRSRIAIAILIIGLSGCASSGTRSVWQAYPGATPSMPLQQAQDVCRSAAQASRSGAQANYDAKNRTYSATPNIYGGYDVSSSNSSSGGFWGGFAQGAARGQVGTSAYSRTMTGCMAERGYQRAKSSEVRPSTQLSESKRSTTSEGQLTTRNIATSPDVPANNSSLSQGEQKNNMDSQTLTSRKYAEIERCGHPYQIACICKQYTVFNTNKYRREWFWPGIPSKERDQVLAMASYSSFSTDSCPQKAD